MSETYPEWAKQRVRQYCASHVQEVELECDAFLGFVQYITEHEEPPPDPMLDEAREIVASWYERNPEKVMVGSRDPANIRLGSMDETPEFLQALAAIRRGMELAQGGEV